MREKLINKYYGIIMSHAKDFLFSTKKIENDLKSTIGVIIDANRQYILDDKLYLSFIVQKALTAWEPNESSRKSRFTRHFFIFLNNIASNEVEAIKDLSSYSSYITPDSPFFSLWEVISREYDSVHMELSYRESYSVNCFLKYVFGYVIYNYDSNWKLYLKGIIECIKPYTTFLEFCRINDINKYNLSELVNFIRIIEPEDDVTKTTGSAK